MGIDHEPERGNTSTIFMPEYKDLPPPSVEALGSIFKVKAKLLMDSKDKATIFASELTRRGKLKAIGVSDVFLAKIDYAGDQATFWRALVMKASVFGYPENIRLLLFAVQEKIIDDPAIQEKITSLLEPIGREQS